MAVIMTAANVAFGMYRNSSVNRPSDNSMRPPVKRPPSVVCTPLALLTAVRVNDPVVGIDSTNEPIILHTPSAIISCVASTDLPFAVSECVWCAEKRKNDFCFGFLLLFFFCCRQFSDLQNALAMAMLSIMETNGMATSDEPKFEIIPAKSTVSLAIVV